MLMLPSHARFGKDRRLAHVVPPVERDAGDVEGEEHLKREIGPAGCGNVGAESARDEEATSRLDPAGAGNGGAESAGHEEPTDRADCADDAECGPRFQPRCFEPERASSLALAL